MTYAQSNGEQGAVVTKVSPRSVDETVSRLVEILANKGVKLFDVIDQSAEARKVGLQLRETTLVIFGNPSAGTPVIVEAPLAALDLPLKLLIWADGHQTKVSYLSPAELSARYQLSDELAQNLASIGALSDALVAE